MVASKRFGASASTTRAHDHLSEMITHARIGGQVLPNHRTPSGNDLGSAEQFVRAWNAVEGAEDSSTSAAVAHPAGPSRVLQSLHSVQASFTEAKQLIEVTLPNLAFTLS